MVGAQYCCKVARLETKDGCPLNPGANLNRTFTMKPLAQMCAHERGLALDASLSKVRSPNLDGYPTNRGQSLRAKELWHHGVAVAKKP